MPDLNLAGSDGFNIASGYSIQRQPDPGKPAPYIPELHGSPALGGVDPNAPVPVLNLAGVEGVPPPSQLVRSMPDNTIHLPDSDRPDFSQPALKLAAGNTPAITFEQRAEFAADPMLPDLDTYRQPYGLDIHNLAGVSNSSLLPGDDSPNPLVQSLFKPDPLLADLLNYELPSGASVCRDPLAPDPLVPDLQQPQMFPDVVMRNRPGDLDPDALQQMHLQPLYKQLDGVPYAQVFMDQSGMNTTQRRHYDLLISGLDSEA